MTKLPRWWCIEINGRFLGRCFATQDEILKACGPYCSIIGNLVNIWNKPRA